MAAQLKEIVSRLSGEPFNMSLSLVDFDQKEPFELMEILNTVLKDVDPKQELNLRDEQPDQACQQIMEFLTILGYSRQFDIEAQQGLLAGEKDTVHPILYWLLSNLDALRKRAYLAKFCVNLEVPEEFLRDEQVYEVFQHYKELQGQFKATHMHLEQVRQEHLDPTSMQSEVAQLEAEKDQLAQKIKQIKDRTGRDEAFQTILNVTSMLRKEQEEEARLAEKLDEQRMQLEQVEQQYLSEMSRLRELREAQDSSSESSADVMLKLLRSDVAKLRDQHGRVKREREEKIERLQELNQALSDPPVTQQDIERLEDEVNLMTQQIQQHSETVEQHNQDKRLAVYKQQASLVAKKKETVLKEHQALEEERNQLGRELSMKEREYEAQKGHKFMTRDEFKSYAASLRETSVKFKRYKSELNELRSENAVLARTVQVLQAKDPTPAGMREVEQQLEKASVEKASVDKTKGKTLDEISQIVQQINAQLREKKNKLAPQIKALRSARQNFQAVESKHSEKKGAYDQVKLEVETDLKRISSEVVRLEAETQDSEKSYHELNMQVVLADSQMQRAAAEARRLRREERYSDQYNTLSERYSNEISNLDNLCRELRKEQANVKERFTDNLKQKRNFAMLEGLMKVKLRCAQQEASSGGLAGAIYSGRQVMTDMSMAGVERLVIE
jgi:intraflagellar transport protein 81